MMKRFIAACLALLLLFSMAACTTNSNDNPTVPTEPSEPTEPTLPTFVAEEPELKNGVYQLYNPNHLLYMAEHPDKDYALCWNIDLCGTTWTPIDNFTGTLTGLIGNVFNFTISNAVIEAGEGDTNVGFFRTVTGTVKEVNFENITLSGSGVFTGNAGIVVGDSASQLVDVDARNCSLQLTVKDANVGILAGKVAEKVEDCYTSGTLDVTLAGGTSYVAGGVGQAAKNVSSLEAHVNVTVAETEQTAGAAGGAVGLMKNTLSAATFGGHFKVTANAAYGAGAIVGELDGKALNCANCARTNVVNGTAVTNHFGIMSSTAKESGSYYRDLSNIEDTLSEEEYAMRKQMVDYMYQMCSIVWRPVEDMNTACVSHSTCRNVYKAGVVYVGMPYTHEGATLESFLTCVDKGGNVNEGVASTRWFDLMGNDCMDAVAWAWSLTSSAFTFFDTSMAVGMCGAIAVGDYEFTSIANTKDVWAGNGNQKMYEALAKVQMGDAVLVRTDSSGHIRMAAESAYVFRNADGSIDPNKSYIVMHEQGASSNLVERHSTCAINKKYTFASLASAGYIPITTEEIKAGTPAKLEVSCSNDKLDKTGLGVGNVVSSHRISRITVRVTDANGAKVYDNFVYPFNGRAECKTYSLRTGFYSELSKLSLKSGAQYTYEVLVLAAGQEVCAQTFSFTA